MEHALYLPFHRRTPRRQSNAAHRAPESAKIPSEKLSAETVTELVAAIDADQESVRRNDWPERDRAIVFTSLLAGLRAEELISARIGDIRRTGDGGVLHVHGKGNKDRRIFWQRAFRRSGAVSRKPCRSLSTSTQAVTGSGVLSSLSPTAPLFVGADG